MAQTEVIRIGTRGSRLALWQAGTVRDRLAAALALPAEAIDIVAITTSGDRVKDRPLAEAGGKALFSKEIEDALLDGRVDLGVHSAKDLESRLPPGLVIGAVLEREDVRDALIAPRAGSLAALPEGARFGTASPRRTALVRRARPDLAIGLLRGNVPTRLQRVEEGVFDATLLAAAGLNRLGLEGHIAEYLPLADFPPACGQGAIAIQCRAADARMRDRLAAIDHADTSAAIACERAFLAALGGSCRTPAAGYARHADGTFRFDGLVLAPDGSESVAAGGTGSAADAEALGRAAGEEVRARAGAALLAALGIA
jgi:hydroxymethylbilane synthase